MENLHFPVVVQQPVENDGWLYGRRFHGHLHLHKRKRDRVRSRRWHRERIPDPTYDPETATEQELSLSTVKRSKVWR